jgi:periplasmic divalent cation tolerance protein
MTARLAFSTAPDLETARSIVRKLVEEKLVACGNLLSGVTSIYRWKAAVEEAGEVLIIFKTTDDAMPGLVTRLAELHPYEVPELVAVDVKEGLPDYLAWIAASTGGNDG